MIHESPDGGNTHTSRETYITNKTNIGNTSMDWLFEQLWEAPKDKFTWHSILGKAKEMHKQEIIDAAERWKGTDFAERYYQETFVSKGSDDTPMERKLLKSGFVDIVPKQENHISDISKMVELPQQEISDEEIEKAVNEYAEVYQCPSEISMCKHDVISAWNNAIKWYKEQLKSNGNGK